jgi:hypothetical protein
LALAHVDDMPEQTIWRPFHKGDFDDHLGPDPMDPAKHSGDLSRVPRGGGSTGRSQLAGG